MKKGRETNDGKNRKNNQGNWQNRWRCKRERERESNRLEKVAQICDVKNNEYNTENIDKSSSKNETIRSTLLVYAKSVCKNKIIKEDKAKRIDYIANRRKAKLLFTG